MCLIGFTFYLTECWKEHTCESSEHGCSPVPPTLPMDSYEHIANVNNDLGPEPFGGDIVSVATGIPQKSLYLIFLHSEHKS
jgi:hypothetical protein